MSRRVVVEDVRGEKRITRCPNCGKTCVLAAGRKVLACPACGFHWKGGGHDGHRD